MVSGFGVITSDTFISASLDEALLGARAAAEVPTTVPTALSEAADSAPPNDARKPEHGTLALDRPVSANGSWLSPCPASASCGSPACPPRAHECTRDAEQFVEQVLAGERRLRCQR